MNHNKQYLETFVFKIYNTISIFILNELVFLTFLSTYIILKFQKFRAWRMSDLPSPMDRIILAQYPDLGELHPATLYVNDCL